MKHNPLDTVNAYYTDYSILAGIGIVLLGMFIVLPMIVRGRRNPLDDKFL